MDPSFPGGARADRDGLPRPRDHRRPGRRADPVASGTVDMEGSMKTERVTSPMSNQRRCDAYNAQNGHLGGVERYTPRQNRRIRKYIRRLAGNRES